VWDAATGERLQALAGHTGEVRALAVWESLLVSGSADRSVRVWAMGPGAPWPCERTLAGEEEPVCALAVWRGRVVCGSEGPRVRVWDAATGAQEAAFAAHEFGVLGLAVRGDRLFTSSLDGEVREWAAGTWTALRRVQMYPGDFERRSLCLAVSGSKLVSGADDGSEVLVLDLETLDCERALAQPAGVGSLAALGGEVWAGVGQEVVVWGREL
jgi:WD40 repeat protein